ncbi:MAG TPA: S41 family peptidase [Chitinophaga sp.]|uniref:S41 family peptidase n=1 Tax=Chitinophaga sp. TaxID=1869181 RepID=UPI002D09C7BE|nr:S41 family peptidase [Chitinophaga sp.]HVI48447.1 S41 family peptidase [Chitinophaga sp.]
MRQSLFITCLTLAVAASNGSYAQSEKTTTMTAASRALLPVEGMQKDLLVLCDAFKEIHPAYGLYTSGDSLQRLYSTTVNALSRPLSEDEFIDVVYPFVSALKCGHTQVKHSVNYQPSSTYSAPHLPFQVLVQNGRVWITTSRLTTMQTGDELLSINNVPVADIIKHGGDLYAADGNNQTFKELFLSEYDGFEDACNKYYRWKPPYHITFKTSQGAIKTISADTTGKSLQSTVKEVDNYKNWSSAVNTDYLPLRFLRHSAAACFEVHSYQYQDTVIFEKTFKEIREKGVKHLIIDLRHNTGGDIRIAAKLMTYLADNPFQMVGDLWARVPDPGKTRFTAYFDSSGMESFFQSFQPTGIKKNEHYPVAFQPAFGNLLEKTNLDKKYHYNGDLIVLIDGATFSSGAHTAAVIKQNCRKATFIGRETAGGSEGCSGGSIQHLTLPNTGVVIDFPLLRVVSVIRRPTYGHGIMPDYTVLLTPLDIVTKRDPDLLEALSIISARD